MNFLKSLLIVFLIIISGCRSGENKKESIMLLHYFTGNFAKGFEDFTNEVNKKSKDINLISTPMEHEEFKVNIRVQLETDNPPDLFSYWAGAKTEYLVDENKVYPISSIFNSGINKSIFDQATINACSYNDEMYIFPLTRHYVGFFYNKTLFNQLGLSAPGTWEELISTAQKLKENSVKPFALGSKNRWPAQFWFDYILLRTAGHEYRRDLMNKAASYTDLEVLKTMDLWKNLLDNKYFNEDYAQLTWDDAAEQLTTGKSAMTLMGTWVIPFLEEQDKTYEYGFFPFPLINEEVEFTSLGPIDGILIAQGTKKKEYALEILQYLAIAEVQEALNKKSGAIAPHLGVDDSIYSPMQLEIKELMMKNYVWAFNYDLATEPFISEAGLDFFVDFIENPDKYENLLTDLQKKISQ